MKNTAFRVLFAALCLLLLCAAGVSAAEYDVNELEGNIIQPGDKICIDQYKYDIGFSALWEEVPLVTPTPAPGKDWYVINTEDLPKTGYGPDSRPLLYALAALWMTRRKRSTEK